MEWVRQVGSIATAMGILAVTTPACSSGSGTSGSGGGASSSSGSSAEDCSSYNLGACNVCCRSDADCKCGTSCTRINSSDHQCTIPCDNDGDCAQFEASTCAYSAYLGYSYCNWLVGR